MIGQSGESSADTGANKAGPASTRQGLSREIENLARYLKPDYFKTKRWFGSKSKNISDFRVVDWAVLGDEAALMSLILLEIAYSDDESERYHLPLVFGPAARVPV